MTPKASGERKGTNLGEEDDASLRQLWTAAITHTPEPLSCFHSRRAHEENASEINSSQRIHKHLSLNKLIKSDFKGSVMQRGLQIEQCTVFITRA